MATKLEALVRGFEAKRPPPTANSIRKELELIFKKGARIDIPADCPLRQIRAIQFVFECAKLSAAASAQAPFREFPIRITSLDEDKNREYTKIKIAADRLGKGQKVVAQILVSTDVDFNVEIDGEEGPVVAFEAAIRANIVSYKLLPGS